MPTFLSEPLAAPHCSLRKDISKLPIPMRPNKWTAHPHRPQTAKRTFDFARPHSCLSKDNDDPFCVCSVCKCDSDGHAVADMFHNVYKRSIRNCHSACQTNASWKNPSDWLAAVFCRDRRAQPSNATWLAERPLY